MTNYLTVFAIRIRLGPKKSVQVHDVSPAEAVQKFLKEIAPFKLTPDQIDTVKAEFKEIKF